MYAVNAHTEVTAQLGWGRTVTGEVQLFATGFGGVTMDREDMGLFGTRREAQFVAEELERTTSHSWFIIDK